MRGTRLSGADRPHAQRKGLSTRLQQVLLIAVSVWMCVVFVAPLAALFSRAFQSEAGQYIGLGNFIHYLTTPALSQAITNSLTVAAFTVAIALVLGFGYAYAITRTAIPCKAVLRYAILVPLFVPTMTHGLALVYLFGNQGLVTRGLWGVVPPIDIGLYGPTGIVVAGVLYTLPQVVLILAVALKGADYRLYEAAESLGAGGLRKLFTVTLPNIRYGLISAGIVAFTLSFTDFGAAKVVGGRYQVLAVDIYEQVVGQQNLSMGATVGIVLLIPALVAFVIDQIAQRQQSALVSSRSVPYKITPQRMRDWALLGYCGVIAASFIGVIATVVLASLVTFWPYNMELTLRHYSFQDVGGFGLQPFWNSIKVASLAALFGTAIAFVSAYLVEKTRGLILLRKANYLLGILPLAVPGLSIGLGYIFFFNISTFSIPFTGLEVANPLHALYGTLGILVLSAMVYFYAVPFLTATTALKQLDGEYEQVAESMAVPFYTTFGRVTVPMSLSAILEMAMFYFVNAMTTISAVVFLWSPETKLASVAIVNMDDAGNLAAAAAMSVLILGTNLVVRVVYQVATNSVGKRAERWRSAEGAA